MNAAFVFHPAAEAELREIVRYTRKQWGEAPARKYAAGLRDCIQALANGKKPYKDMSGLYPALRMARCERHYVFLLTAARCARPGCRNLARAHGYHGTPCTSP